MQMERNDKGITLVSLVVTIVVLIILATISLKSVFSDKGITERAVKEEEALANQVKQQEERMNTMLQEYKNMVDGQ